MNSSLFRKLLLAALALLAVTVFLVYYTLTSYAEQLGNPVAEMVRNRVLWIALSAPALAIVVAAMVAHSLTNRVIRLKHLADGMLGLAPEKRNMIGEQDDLGSLERSLSGVASELSTLVQDLRFESARREAVLAGMTEGVLAVDRETRVTFCNQPLLRAIGYRGEKYEGLGLLELVRDPALHDLIRRTLNTGEPAKLRFHLFADTHTSAKVLTVSRALPTQP